MTMKAIFVSVRSGSTRLPQKALMEIGSRTTIEYLIDRVKQSKHASRIVMCTTELPEDDRLCEIAEQNEILFFRGSAPDKLKRWLGAAKKYDIDFFVNADGDDLFFDAGLADICFEQYENSEATLDFIDGRGLYNDVYGIKTSALQKVCDNKDDLDTEFVRPYFVEKAYGNNLIFKKIHPVPNKYEKREIRMTLDYEEDFIFFKTIINHFTTERRDMSFENILSFLDENPDIVRTNWHLEKAWKENQDNMINRMSEGHIV